MSDAAYLDHAASAPLDPRVRAAMDAAQALDGNPSSVHGPGRAARAAVDRARAQVAALLGVPSAEVVITSGATEANAAAVRGVLRAVRAAHPGRALRVVLSALEHTSLAGSVEAAVADGVATATTVPPGPDGVLRTTDVAAAIDADTVLVCAMWVNNVLGTVQPVEAIAAAVAAERVRRGAGGLPIAFLCDAVQALPALETRGAVADLLTCSAHKIAGPKGVGALRIAAGAPFAAFGGGGGQEEGRRHGTENVAGIVGFGEAARLLADGRPARAARLAELRRAFLSALAETAPRATVVGAEGVPGIVFLRVPGVPGDELALKLDAAGFAVSAGSACDSGSRKAPRVLAAVLDEQAARLGGVRVSFGPATPEDDLRRCAAAIGRSIKTPR